MHFALCHIYSGLSTIPDSVSIVELATIADMLGLEGLKEAIMFTLKAKYCHHFHRVNKTNILCHIVVYLFVIELIALYIIYFRISFTLLPAQQGRHRKRLALTVTIFSAFSRDCVLSGRIKSDLFI